MGHWQRPGEEVLENTHRILRGCQCPHDVWRRSRRKRGAFATSKDKLGISNTSETGLCHCHCDIVKNKYSYIDQCTPPDISKNFFVYCQEVYIDQCKPPDNSKIDFTIVNRCTLINVNLLGRYT